MKNFFGQKVRHTVNEKISSGNFTENDNTLSNPKSGSPYEFTDEEFLKFQNEIIARKGFIKKSDLTTKKP